MATIDEKNAGLQGITPEVFETPKVESFSASSAFEPPKGDVGIPNFGIEGVTPSGKERVTTATFEQPGLSGVTVDTSSKKEPIVSAIAPPTVIAETVETTPPPPPKVIGKGPEKKPVKVEPKKVEPLKQISDDFITSSSKFFQDLQDPNIPDPVKTAQMNELITSFGPKNQAATDSMLLQLKQQGKEGSGSGNALLFNMARGSNSDFSNIAARMNTESALRIFDANKYGMEKGIQLRQQLNNEQKEKFSQDGLLFAAAVEAGDFDEVSRIAAELGLQDLDTRKLEAMSDLELANFTARSLTDLGFIPEGVRQFSGITGIELDPGDIAVLDPAKQSLIENRQDAIAKMTDPEEIALAMEELAREFPEAFGFSGDPDAAANFVNNIDYTNVEGTANSQKAATDFWQTEAVKSSPDIGGVITVGKKYYESYTDASIDSMYNNVEAKFATLDAEEQQAALEGMDQFGVDSIDDIDTREEKEAFLSINQFNNKKKNVHAIGEQMFIDMGKNTYGTSMQSWFDGSDPLKTPIAKEWIANVMIGGKWTKDEFGNILPDISAITPPWEENSDQFNFFTWPRLYDENGNELPEGDQYSGKEFRSDLDNDSVHNDSQSIGEDDALTRKFKQFQKDDPDSGLTWLEWYDESKGGTSEIGKKFDPLTASEDALNESITLGNQALETGDFSNMSTQQQELFFQNDPEAITKAQNSGKVLDVSSNVLNVADFKRLTDFREAFPDLQFDTTRVNTSLSKVSRGGAGAGNGSVILVNGKPYRLVEFVGILRGAETFLQANDRQSIIRAVRLDIPGAEPEDIGGSRGWQSTAD